MFWLYGPLIIVLNNRDYNIDQNNRDYDFCHNRAALLQTAKSEPKRKIKKKEKEKFNNINKTNNNKK